MAEKNCFDITKLICQIMCVMVQWSRGCLQGQINRVRLPATLFSVSLYRYFFPVWSIFLTLFFLLAFFSLFLLQTPLVMHLDQYIYFKLKSGGLFWKRDTKTLDLHTGQAYDQIKNISCQDMSLLWNGWIFFNVSWHHDKNTQYTTNCTNLQPTPTSKS